MTYEFVPKKTYKPIREKIEEVIKKVQKNIKKDTGITFQFKLVGSGKRHLITKIKDGNAGFDFDYNLILNKYNDNPNIRYKFFIAFQNAIKGTIFSKIENSTSVITIKHVSRLDSKIIASCDFSIIYYPEDSDSDYYMYSKFNKNENNYTWEIRDCSRYNNKKLKYLLDEYDGIWLDIKDEYLKLKNSDKQNKHSFILFHEAVNNIYNIYTKDE